MDVTHGKTDHDAHAAHATHEAHEHNPPYMGVFWWLVALTVIEVGAGYLPQLTGGAIELPKLILVPLLLGLAFAKAALVGMFYMHLRYDSKWISIVFLTTFGLALAFVAAIVPRDYWGL
jgi:cytochrome c oxidase subunit IV